jgi:DNA-binding MarR family transcriptional regulator/GNAT superfamily N-acetyltransferase
MLVCMLPAPAVVVPLVRGFSRELARAGGLLSPDYLESGFSLGEVRCLYEIGHSDGLGISSLATRLGLDLGYVSRVVSRLVAQGLATKTTGGADRRAREVVLTRVGRSRLAALGKRADRRLGAWLEGRPASDVEELAAGLRAFLRESEGPIAIEDARPGAIGRIIARHAEIYCSEYAYPPAFEGYVVEAFAEFVKELSPPRDRIFVATRDREMLGSVAMKGLPKRTAQLRFLLVESAARGAGLGRRLVQTALDHARDSGERRVVLETASDLEAARSLYHSVGFRKTRSTPAAPWLPRDVESETWELELAAGRRRSDASPSGETVKSSVRSSSRRARS